MYYRKTVGHLFMKPVQIEGTTQNFLSLGIASVCSRSLATEDDVEWVQVSFLHSPKRPMGTAAKGAVDVANNSVEGSA
jgi:hypothetical protein